MYHWIRVVDSGARGGYYLTHVFFSDEKKFRQEYRRLPRRRAYAKRLAGKRVRVWELKPEGEGDRWVRCSISCNTKESPKWGGRTYKLDATATCFGSKADCVRMLQKGMKKECKTPLPKTVYTNTDYWGYDKGEGWSYLPNSAMDIPVLFEFPDADLERVKEGAEVRSCR